MNWITTNIRFSQDEYMKLKLLSVKRRTSLSALVREAVKQVDTISHIDNQNEILSDLGKIAKTVGKKTKKNWDTVKVLRNIRYL